MIYSRVYSANQIPEILDVHLLQRSLPWGTVRPYFESTKSGHGWFSILKSACVSREVLHDTTCINVINLFTVTLLTG